MAFIVQWYKRVLMFSQSRITVKIHTITQEFKNSESQNCRCFLIISYGLLCSWESWLLVRFTQLHHFAHEIQRKHTIRHHPSWHFLLVWSPSWLYGSINVYRVLWCRCRMYLIHKFTFRRTHVWKNKKMPWFR